MSERYSANWRNRRGSLAFRIAREPGFADA
jgi:hypothetical protein